MALINPVNPISCLDDIQALRGAIDASNSDGKNMISFTPSRYGLFLSTLVDFENVNISPTNANWFSTSYAKVKNFAIDMVRPEYDANGNCCKFSYITEDTRFMDTDFFKANFTGSTIVFWTDLQFKGSNFNFIQGEDYSDIILSFGSILEQAQIVSYVSATQTLVLDRAITIKAGQAMRIMGTPVVGWAAQYDCNFKSKCYRFGVKNTKKECGDVVLAHGCLKLKSCELNFERYKSNDMSDWHMTVAEWLQEFVYKTAEKMFMSSVVTHVINVMINTIKQKHTTAKPTLLDFSACICDPAICDNTAIAANIKSKIFDELETAEIDGDYIAYVDLRAMAKRGRLKPEFNYLSNNVSTVYMPFYNASLEALYTDKIKFKQEMVTSIELANGKKITFVVLEEMVNASQTFGLNVNAAPTIVPNYTIIVPKDYISLVSMREMYLDRNMTIQNKAKDGYLTVVTGKMIGGENTSWINLCDTSFDFGMRYGVLIKNASILPMFIIANIWTKEDCRVNSCSPTTIPVNVVLPASC